MKLYSVIFTIFLLLSFTGCSKENKPLIIATNQWIGYTPLFLAKKQGDLEKLNIKLYETVSLAEAFDIFSIGKADLVTTTQHECNLLKHITNIKPVILLDRSNGGDMILSNKTLLEIKKAKKVSVYLETNSINYEVLMQFISSHNLQRSKFELINMDQAEISTIKYTDKTPILLVTYTPYDHTLEQKGFQTIASTKDLDKLVVIDSLCAKQNVYENSFSKLQKLKKIIDQKILFIQQHPKEAYLLTKRNLGNLSYEEFIDSLQMIKWINSPSDELLNTIEPLGYSKESIIR